MARSGLYKPGQGSPYSVGSNNTFLTFTLIELQKTNQNLLMVGNEALRAASIELHRRIEQVLSIDDHTLAELAANDHPYARRHGSIQIHKDRPWVVHKQSGRLLRSLYRQEQRLSGGVLAIDVGLDPNAVPYVEDVIMGTKKMLPRDVLWERAQQKSTKIALMRAIIASLSAGRTQLGVRFGESSPKQGSLVAITGVRVGASQTFP